MKHMAYSFEPNDDNTQLGIFYESFIFLAPAALRLQFHPTTDALFAYKVLTVLMRGCMGINSKVSADITPQCPSKIR
jgi:hypothetical protein